MADTIDLAHYYGVDLGTTLSGDIATVSKQTRTIQRIIRRFLTNPTDSDSSDYPWEPTYGVGLGARLGQDLDPRGIQADCRSQMLLEPTVSKNPAPVVTVTPLSTGGATISVAYTDISGQPQNFSFNLVP